MRFISFAPAVMALSLFSVSTQALPALSQDRAVALLKRGGDGPGLVNAVIKVFAEVTAKAALDACVNLDVDICAAVDVKLKANANVANLVKVKAAIKEANLDVKANIDVDLKAHVRTAINAQVIANIDGHVHAVLAKICPTISSACLHDHAHAIVADVNAKIKVDIKALVVKVKAGLHAFVKIRADVHIKKLNVNLLKVIGAQISAIIRIKSDIKVHLDAFVKLCIDLAAKVNLVARIGAL
ncbi:hypothetical protein BGZ70_010600 [Mortierella alpina]|uniref:Transmembrane protein n=1 Tax=Mortierella alpina TaxID=64518 RepID=A0A9P6IYU2_MORAP|nr:hypothetical protein BGZ70_010600 [Mortierella alpina]